MLTRPLGSKNAIFSPNWSTLGPRLVKTSPSDSLRGACRFPDSAGTFSTVPVVRAAFARTKSAHDFGAAGAGVAGCSGDSWLTTSPVTCDGFVCPDSGADTDCFGVAGTWGNIGTTGTIVACLGVWVWSRVRDASVVEEGVVGCVESVSDGA